MCSNAGGGGGGKAAKNNEDGLTPINIHDTLKSPEALANESKLDGSEKQVKWARSIEAAVYSSLEKIQFAEQLEFNAALSANVERVKRVAEKNGTLSEANKIWKTKRDNAIIQNSKNSDRNAGVQLLRKSYQELFKSTHATNLINNRQDLQNLNWHRDVANSFASARSRAKARGTELSPKDGAKEIKRLLKKYGGVWNE